MQICCAQATAHWASSTMANIPATIGFYPEESILFVGWFVEDRPYGEQGRYPDSFSAVLTTKEHGMLPGLMLNSGPIMRVDYDDEPALNQVLDYMEEIDVALYSVIAVTKQDNVHEVLNNIADACDTRGLPFLAGWHVTEVLSDEPITMHVVDSERIQELFAHDHMSLQAKEHVIGPVFDIAKSASMQRLSKCGALPALSRQEAVAFVEDLPVADMEKTMDTVYLASLLVPQLRNDPEQLQSYIDQLDDLLQRDPADPDLPAVASPKLPRNKKCPRTMRKETAAASMTTTMSAQDWMAIWFANSFLRDVALGHIFDATEFGAKWAMAIARDFGEVLRANALSVYALLVLNSPLMFQCRPALGAALAAMPGHSLSRLIAHGYDYGYGVDMRNGALQGSKEAETLALQGGLGDAGIML